MRVYAQFTEALWFKGRKFEMLVSIPEMGWLSATGCGLFALTGGLVSVKRDDLI